MENTIINPKEASLYRDTNKVFMRFGIRSVTMDDIARHLRVSKKTLYQYVSDKNDLVQKCCAQECLVTEDSIKSILEKKLNAIDENFEISSFIVSELKDIHPSIFYDMEKYYPEALKTMNELRHDFISEVMASNIQRGMNEGLYREDLDVEIMAALWVTRINLLFDSKAFPIQQINHAKLYEHMFVHHIRGIVSAKGLKYFESKQNQTNQNS